MSCLDKFYKQKLKEYKPLDYAGLIHISGLPMPENVPCLMLSMGDHFLFLRDNQTIRLNANQVQDMVFSFTTQTQNHINSSIGGAVVGGMIAGPLGAAIGGRAKKTQTSTHTRYLTIMARDAAGQPLQLIFNATANKKADDVVAEFRKRPRQEVHINL